MENGHKEVEDEITNVIIETVMHVMGPDSDFEPAEWMQAIGLSEALPEYADHLIQAVAGQALLDAFLGGMGVKDSGTVTVDVLNYLKSSIISSFHAGMAWDQRLIQESAEHVGVQHRIRMRDAIEKLYEAGFSKEAVLGVTAQLFEEIGLE